MVKLWRVCQGRAAGTGAALHGAWSTASRSKRQIRLQPWTATPLSWGFWPVQTMTMQSLKQKCMIR